MKLEKDANDFLLYSYFGFDIQELNNKDKKDDVMLKCAHKAYLDLNRTLAFNDGLPKTQKGINEKRENFTKSVEKMIIAEINAYNYQNDFDKWHEMVCDKIKEYADTAKNIEGDLLIKNKKFSYGQAQKWLNMTLKYLWMLGILNENIEKDKLHVPIDNFILQAIQDSIGVNAKENTLKGKVTTVAKNEQYKFNGSSWSKLDKENYETIQQELKKIISGVPIEWECMAWIEIAKKRSAK